MLKGFRDFILRGNVIDLAVAVVIGTAFSAVVTSIVENLITPLLAAIGGAPDFRNVTIPLGSSAIGIGSIITDILNFLIVAAVVYFVVVAPMNRLLERMRRGSGADAPSAPSREELLLAEIRDAIRERGI